MKNRKFAFVFLAMSFVTGCSSHVMEPDVPRYNDYPYAHQPPPSANPCLDSLAEMGKEAKIKAEKSAAEFRESDFVKDLNKFREETLESLRDSYEEWRNK